MRLAVWPVAPARALADALGDLVTETVEVEPHDAKSALVEGRVDLALLPTLEVFKAADSQDGGIESIPGVALVGERSPRRHIVVGSSLDAIETIGFDPRDAQEALLTQLVLREHYGTQATFALATPETPLSDVLDRQSAALVSVDQPAPAGAFVLDPGQEWLDLTLRPYPWGLLAVRAGALDPDTTQRIVATVQGAGPSDALMADGVLVYQLTLDGYAVDGLDQLADYLFQTGTLSAVPDIPFAALPEPEASSDEAEV
ncbi:MAG: MqnA/MqnD/SBP family protein [Bacteroidota bacterium]